MFMISCFTIISLTIFDDLSSGNYTVTKANARLFY